jgi:hypothetical protein
MASVWGGSRDWRNRHSATDDKGTDATSAGILSTNVSIDLRPLVSGMSSSCALLSTPSVSVCDDESPRKGLNKGAGDGVRRLSIAASEGNERDDRVDVGVPPTSPGRCAVLEPMAWTSADCGNSGLKKFEPYVYRVVVSAALNEGIGGDGVGRPSKRVCAFWMRSSITSF